ncbi:alpha/beta hydrolase fold domain-containing protein [Galbitalea sp. SE-J8]|uniref:alpha/beta hydrolase n=1 Tax=Galbitalea sp. SE-J8 TaxID=3054952 RepID=UPI00259CDB2E|nr:alpha/beta hydrolase fold domain-containing protein [Galbitalea sp. SE-J8]MDM4762600.1 alpha/beta hydrolase fold domain-containing protein [Galbitalea sp. SE-J8]
MTTHPHSAPPFDTELKPVLEIIGRSLSPSLTLADLPALRADPGTATLDQLLADGRMTHEERVIPGPEGAPDVLISIFRGAGQKRGGPGFLFTHVGGMIFGDRFTGIATITPWVDSLDAVIVTVEYRLAPENPAPAALEDAFAALLWTADHAEELGFDPDRLVTVGASAGGGLAAGLTLMARDRGGPALAAQILMYAMLDERNDTASSRQIDGIGVWDRHSNEMGWSALLGDRRGTDAVTPYESPSRATELAGLPPTYLEVGSAEVFRDEMVAYASGIWAAGGDAELHVWPGGFHLFELFAPRAALSVAAREARTAWARRLPPA